MQERRSTPPPPQTTSPGLRANPQRSTGSPHLPPVKTSEGRHIQRRRRRRVVRVDPKRRYLSPRARDLFSKGLNHVQFLGAGGGRSRAAKISEVPSSLQETVRNPARAVQQDQTFERRIQNEKSRDPIPVLIRRDNEPKESEVLRKLEMGGRGRNLNPTSLPGGSEESTLIPGQADKGGPRRARGPTFTERLDEGRGLR